MSRPGISVFCGEYMRFEITTKNENRRRIFDDIIKAVPGFSICKSSRSYVNHTYCSVFSPDIKISRLEACLVS